MNKGRISILIVDDHPIVREGLGTLIRRSPELELVGEAASGIEAVKQAGALDPDVILMDIRLPGMDGFAATREILVKNPGAKILMLTTFDEDGLAKRAIAAGAKGVLLKDADPDTLVHAVFSAAAGSMILDETFSQDFLRPAGPQLTERERDIVRLVSDGLSNREIGKRLYLTENTVKTHLANLFQKLEVHDRQEAALEAERQGLV